MTTNKIPYTPPEYQGSAFNCPHCNAFSNQIWKEVEEISYNRQTIPGLDICTCSHCKRFSIWFEETMIYPNYLGVEIPNVDLSDDIKGDYHEASEILQKSPRGAAALLRLAVQKLCVQLGESDKDLNTAIGNLVKRNLPVMIQKSLDSLRVIGNEAVHPGQMDLKDDVNTAHSLFKLINLIAEKMITEPKEIDEIFNKIPETKKVQIVERDKQNT